MSLVNLLEQARLEERRLAAARKAAWETDPGNLGIAHTWLNAMGYHTAWHAWDEARARVKLLEQQLALASSAANDTAGEVGQCSR